MNKFLFGCISTLLAIAMVSCGSVQTNNPKENDPGLEVPDDGEDPGETPGEGEEEPEDGIYLLESGTYQFTSGVMNSDVCQLGFFPSQMVGTSTYLLVVGNQLVMEDQVTLIRTDNQLLGEVHNVEAPPGLDCEIKHDTFFEGEVYGNNQLRMLHLVNISTNAGEKCAEMGFGDPCESSFTLEMTRISN